MSIRVLIADDHPVVRDGLSALLGAVDGIEVVGVAANGHDAVRAAVELLPDVTVLDVHMPGLDGVAAAREIARLAPTVAVLMLTMSADDDTVRAAIRAGAAGYILKGASRDQIERAIRTVAAGDTVLGAEIAAGALSPGASSPGRAGDRLAHLSPREQQILGLLAGGHSTAAISTRLGVATKTINNNLSTIFAKLGVTNRTAAALIAQEAGLGGSRTR